jgi:hypothetical protein
MSLGRFPAGLLAGGIGGLILILLGFTGENWIIFSLLGAVVLGILVGLAAGFFIGGNPAFAGRTAGNGALAGLIAGAFLLVGQIIGGIIAANQPDAQLTIQSVLQSTSSGQTLTPSEAAAAGVLSFVLIGGCFGLLGVGAASGLGAAGGALGGRNNRAVNPYAPYGAPPMPGFNAPPSSMPYGYPPQQGMPPYPPQQPQPPSAYGSLAQGQYANPQQEPGAPPYPQYPPFPPPQQ